jgi:WD40 repeat protein
VAEIDTPPEGLRLLTLSPDGKLVAGGFADGTVRVWDLASRRRLAAFQAHTQMVLSLAFSPDGKSLASGTRDQVLKVWELARVMTAPPAEKPLPRAEPPAPAPRTAPRPPTPDEAALAGKARAVLATHCHRCHGQDGAAEGGLNYLLDRNRLLSTRLVEAGAAGRSLLLRRIRRGEMPPEDEKPRPGPEDLAALEKWITAGAPDWDEASRRPIPPAEVVRRVREDRDRLEGERRQFARYFMLTPLYNAGCSEDELQTARLALSRLVNSLSRGTRVVPPQPIDPERTIVRIDLRDYRWSEPDWGGLIAGHEPFSRSFPAAAGAPPEPLPVRADWFVHAFSRPPLYHRLLELEPTAARVEGALGVNAGENIRTSKVLRAGFNGSGIARHNRLLERHEGRDGYYWKSYDFAAPGGRRDLFAHPRGPAPGENTFQHDGGEIIFALPNGLQGYLLVDARGNRIDRAPSAIVSDPRHPEHVVENGISCMSCHTARGLIDKADQVRAHVEKNPDAFREDERPAILALYPPREKFAAALRADAERYRQALAQTGSAARGTEPIVVTALRFEADLGLKEAAAELWLAPDELQQRLADFPSLGRSLGVLRTDGGTIPRAVFTSNFAQLVEVFRIGAPGIGGGQEPRGWWETNVTGREVTPRSAAEFAATDFHPLAGGQKAPGLPAPVIDPTFTRLAVLDGDRTVQLLDAATGKPLVPPLAHAEPLSALAFSFDGSLLATGTLGILRVWDVRTGACKAQTERPREIDGLPRWGQTIFALSFSPDGQLLAGNGQGRRGTLVELWDTATLKPVESLRLDGRNAAHVAFSPDGKVLVSADDFWSGPPVVVWDLEAGRLRGRLRGHAGAIGSVGFSPDGKKITTTTADGAIRLWDVRTCDQISIDRLLTGAREPNAVVSLAFSADGKMFATAHDDGSLALWDAEAFRDRLVIQAHPPGVLRRVSFARDGKRLVSMGRDGSVKFWDVGKMLRAAERP